MPAPSRSFILHRDDETWVLKEEVRPLNPLAIGVTLGGLLLDRVVPRPKPRAGIASAPLRSTPAVPRTPWRAHRIEEYGEAPSASRLPLPVP
jgi:hypothetical protein